MKSDQRQTPHCHLSGIDPSEIERLTLRYGAPIRRRYDIQTDDYLRVHRWRPVPDRRGEVVFAVKQENGEILLHSKHAYEKPIYRLPTGGIGLAESIEDALYREVEEETGQAILSCRLLGILDCRFHLNGASAAFASYVFFLESAGGEPRPDYSGEPADFTTVAPGRLPTVAASLRSLTGKRHCWGYWRSLSHVLVHDVLTSKNARLN